MTSNINPNNIDGAYPVAGQDNNSQGFRDNFTNTSTNFQFAADEISDLQAKVVLKAPLTGQSSVNNNMLGQPLTNALLSNMREKVLALNTVSGPVSINYALSSYQTLTTGGSVSLSFTNFPAAGAAGSVVIQVYVSNVDHTLTLPVAVSVNNQGIQGAVVSGSGTTITFATVGYYSFEFTTSDGGTTITVNEVNKPLQPFNSSIELISANSNISLSTASSVITSNNNLVAILPAGVGGQTKVLAYGNATSGNALVTVVNAGWKSTGNGVANLSATGSAVTLQYLNSKWYAIGNNGVTFS